MDLTAIKIWPIVAGLGLFLFGMHLLEEAIRKLGGRNFKKFLRKHTGNPIKAVMAGTFFTLILQSSSMVTLLVMSFAGAGIIALRNGIGMVLGANLGTTLKGWIISLLGFKINIGEFILPFLAIGALGSVFLQNENWKGSAKILLGLSFMFLGLDFMKNGFELFAQNLDLEFLHGRNPILFVLFGAMLSGTIQSSSASMMMFLSSYAAGIISLEQGFYLVIGGDLGTTVTAILGTIKANALKRKVGYSQFLFNLINGGLALLLAPYYGKFLLDVIGIKDGLVAIVAFHSLLNLVGIILFLPFLKWFVILVNKIVKERGGSQLKILDKVAHDEIHAANEALYKESKLFFYQSIRTCEAFFDLNKEVKTNPLLAYNVLKEYENEIAIFYLKFQRNHLRTEDMQLVNFLIATTRNASLAAKDLKDINHNLVALKEVVSNKLFNLHILIQQKQELVYAMAKDLMLNIDSVNEQKIETFNQLNAKHYTAFSEYLTDAFEKKEKREIDFPTLLNLIREVNNSNEAMMRSLNNFLLMKRQLELS